MPWLINAAQLDKLRKSQKNVIILDASWHLPAENRHPYQEFLASHITGARFLDLHSFHDHQTNLPNMLLRDEQLISQKLAALGITNEHKIILYDSSASHSSCRALWMFKVFGHDPNLLYLLDGGYESWARFGGKTETGEARNVVTRNYTLNFEARYIRTLMQMKANYKHPMEQVIDTRHAVRYAGGAEPRPGLRAGHIPGSICFPSLSMFEANGTFKPTEKIRKQLTGLGVELNKPIITMCGSGMTAAILSFMLDLMNANEHALYDGSWSEWGAEQCFPGETDLSERPVITSLDEVEPNQIKES